MIPSFIRRVVSCPRHVVSISSVVICTISANTDTFCVYIKRPWPRTDAFWVLHHFAPPVLPRASPSCREKDHAIAAVGVYRSIRLSVHQSSFRLPFHGGSCGGEARGQGGAHLQATRPLRPHHLGSLSSSCRIKLEYVLDSHWCLLNRTQRKHVCMLTC